MKSSRFNLKFCLLQDGALFYKKSGLGALPLALFNGVPLSPDEMDPEELETVILQRIMDTTTAFQRAVFMVGHEKRFALHIQPMKPTSFFVI